MESIIHIRPLSYKNSLSKITLFFERNLTAERYLDLLRFELIPALVVLFSEEIDSDIPIERIWFQQDEVPPHFAPNVRRYFNGHQYTQTKCHSNILFEDSDI